MKIMFVCTGNTCRSPMAEGIFSQMIKEENLRDIEVSSGGLLAFSGDEVTNYAVKAAMKYGADISSHRSRGVDHRDLTDTDLFVCMTRGHEEHLLDFLPRERVCVLGGGISDPFGYDEETYERCAGEIYESLKELLKELKSAVLVSKMTAEDIKEIALIEKECFSSPWSERSLEEELHNENAFFLKAVCKNKVTGYIGVHSTAGECYIDNIAVKKIERKKGTGSKLLDRAIRDAILRRDEFISLEVRKSNEEAVRLYSRFGFEKAGERKNFYSDPPEDGDIMTLKLKVEE